MCCMKNQMLGTKIVGGRCRTETDVPDPHQITHPIVRACVAEARGGTYAVRRQRRAQRAPSSCSRRRGWRRTAQPCGSQGCGLVFSARLGKSCQNAQVHFDDFPIKAWRAFLVLFESPAGISSRFCSPQNERNSSLSGRAVRAALPIGSLYPNRMELPSGRAGPTSRGREMLRISAAVSAQSFVNWGSPSQ